MLNNFGAMIGEKFDTFASILINTFMHPKEQIEAIANTLLPSFIPKNKTETSFFFHFTLPPDSSYKVSFEKDSQSNWQYKGFEVAER